MSRRRPVASDKRFRKASPTSDFGPPERWQHSGRALTLTEQAGILAARATEECVLDVLGLKNLLDEKQVAAGLKLRLDFQRAGLARRVAASYTPLRVSGDNPAMERERSESEETAYRRWRLAVRELGLHHSDTVIAIACQDQTPRQTDIAVLQKGLDLLVKWYGLNVRQPQSSRVQA